jgi:hypothetical protein
MPGSQTLRTRDTRALAKEDDMIKKSQSAEALIERLSKLSNGLIASGEQTPVPQYPVLKPVVGSDALHGQLNG